MLSRKYCASSYGDQVAQSSKLDTSMATRAYQHTHYGRNVAPSNR